MKTSSVRARIEPELKSKAENILSKMGITPSQAIIMLYKHLAQNHSWPFPLKTLNAKTIESFNSKDKDANLKRGGIFERICRKLGI